MTSFPSAARFASIPKSLVSIGLVCAVGVACDDGPGVSTEQRAPDGSGGRAGTSGVGGAGQVGGNGPQTGGTSSSGGSAQGGGAGAGPIGGNTQVGGSGSGNFGGSATAGTGGSVGNLCAGKPSPAGCFENGCESGFTCTQRADVCVPSGCVCDPASGWACTADCGGGSCVANVGKRYARLGFSSGQQKIADWCVAYELGADGAPVFASLGLLLSHFTDPKLFDGQPKLTRYIELEGTPIAWGFTATGTCGKEASYGVEARDVPFQTVLALPESGEAMRMWTLADSGPNEGTSLNTRARVINALAASQPITATLVATGDIALGPLPFANAPSYTPVPGGSLQRVDLVGPGGKKSALDFVQFDLLPVEHTTIILRGFEGAESAIICNDAKPAMGPFGEPPPDVFSSGCAVVQVK